MLYLAPVLIHSLFGLSKAADFTKCSPITFLYEKGSLRGSENFPKVPSSLRYAFLQLFVDVCSSIQLLVSCLSPKKIEKSSYILNQI